MKRLTVVAAVGLSLGLVSCGENKEQVAKSEAQKERIAGLQDQVDDLKDRLGSPEGGDPAAELAKAKESLAKATERVESLRAELAALSKERSDLEKEFKEYKKTYQIPE